MKNNKPKNLKFSLRQKIALVTLGLLLSLVLLETGMRIAGSILSFLQERRNIVAVRQRGTYRIICLGESTTAGYERSYPYLLQEVLNRRNIGVKFSVINKGYPGMDTSDILEQLEANLDKYKPDMVITMMGINDFGMHMPYEEVAPGGSKPFWRGLKTYKLFRLIFLHAKSKIKEIKLAISRFNIKNDSSNVSKSTLKNPSLQKKRISRKEDLKKKIKSDPQNYQAYVELGHLLKTEGRYGEAEEVLIRAIAVKPENTMAYNGLGAVYILQNKEDESEKCFLKAIELNPYDDGAYMQLGKICERRQDIKRAGDYYEKVVALNLSGVGGCLELAWVYKNQGKFSEIEEVMKKAIEASPEEERRYAAMEILYREMGNLELSEAYRIKAEELIKKFYQPTTVANYLRLKQILHKRSIKYVCMQYPMRSIEPLKRIFKSENGVVFIDNEMVFRNAVEKKGYNEYFDDMFGGDFGHCTLKGNRLIAKNAAKVILKDCFNK